MTMVTVTFAPFKRFAQIYIDGDHISPYSDLAICESRDLHVCGVRLLKLLDDEIANEYKLVVQGETFQIELMTALAKHSDFCVAVQGEPICLAFRAADTFEFASELCQKYSLNVDQNTNVSISGNLAEQGLIETAILDDSGELLIVDSVPDAVDKAKTVLLVTDHFDIKNTRSINTVEIPDSHVRAFVEYYYYYVKVIPFIDAVFSRSRFAPLSVEDRLLLDAYVSQQPKYTFNVRKTSIDVGEKTEFMLKVYPQSASSAYQINIDNPQIAVIAGNIITAVSEGMAILSVSDNNGKILESKQLLISKHIYVNSIRLVSSSASLEIDKQGHIDAYVLPEDAEDANSLKWTSSDPDVVHVTSTGDFITGRPGTAVITVAANVCSQQINITVCPSLERISLSKSSLTVEVGGSETVSCNLYPQNAAHDRIIWELSNDGMGTLNVSSDGMTCTFSATTSSIVRGNLKCYIKGTEKSAACSIEIIPEQKPTGLMTCAMIFSIIGLVLSFLIPLMWAGGGGISGFFADFFLPVGIIISLIGKAKTNNKEKIFSTMLKLDLIFTGIMFFFAITCCNPHY